MSTKPQPGLEHSRELLFLAGRRRGRPASQSVQSVSPGRPSPTAHSSHGCQCPPPPGPAWSPPPPPRSHGTCAAAASGGSAGWLWSVGACQATCPACCWFGCTDSRRPTCECRPAAHCPAPRAPLALQGDPLCRPAPMVAMYYSARVFCTDSIRRERMQPLCSLTLRSFGLCLCGSVD